MVYLALINQGLEFQEAQLRLFNIYTRSSSICINLQYSRIILSRLDAIGQHCYLFLVFKFIETVVNMEIRLDMVMHLVVIDILHNPPSSGLPVVAKEEDP